MNLLKRLKLLSRSFFYKYTFERPDHRITWNIYKTHYLFIKSLDIEQPVSDAVGSQSNCSSPVGDNEEEKLQKKKMTNHLCTNLASLIHNSNLWKDFKMSHLLEKVLCVPDCFEWLFRVLNEDLI